jgi:hypothetical protein
VLGGFALRRWTYARTVALGGHVAPGPGRRPAGPTPRQLRVALALDAGLYVAARAGTLRVAQAVLAEGLVVPGLLFLPVALLLLAGTVVLAFLVVSALVRLGTFLPEPVRERSRAELRLGRAVGVSTVGLRFVTPVVLLVGTVEPAAPAVLSVVAFAGVVAPVGFVLGRLRIWKALGRWLEPAA